MFYYIYLLFFLLITSCTSQESWTKSSETLKIAIEEEPSTLDPRLVRDLASVTVLHMLYEGLMYNDYGKISPGIAESITISPDGKKYTFHLKETHWSNGDPLTSQDFAETWKSILNPSFPSVIAHHLFLIKGAKDAKEGKIPLDEVGIESPDVNTLVIKLEGATPYFLEALSQYFYFPIHASLREDDRVSNRTWITNGPFKLVQWNHRKELVLSKNVSYWDAQSVKLKDIAILPLAANTALQMFLRADLDWMGSPLSTIPQDTISFLEDQKKLEIMPGAGTHWFRFNTEAVPFNNLNMRKAFTYALNREGIVTHVTQGYQIPALGVIPLTFEFKHSKYFQDNDISAAVVAFQKALKELNISKENLPTITLHYAAGDRNHKIAQAVQQQWKKALGIAIEIEQNEAQVIFQKLTQGNFQIIPGAWYADFRDPIAFLEVFKYKSNRTNNTNWENEKYRLLLEQSTLIQSDPLQRMELLAEAEKILIEELPIAPLFFASFNYVKQARVSGVYFSDLGYLDFKYAKLENK